ncbi:MAG: ROK family protein [Solirubrobacteraceae bacterium]
MLAERIVAIDLGGTSLKGAVVSEATPEVAIRPTPAAEGPDAVVDAVAGFAAELVGGAQAVAGIGLAVPGIVDEDSGTVIEAANLGWRDVAIGPVVQERVGVPVSLRHDVRAAALAEGTVGAARGYNDYLLLTLGTGVGAAVVFGGKPYTGLGGRGGELGHTTVDPGGPLCACGGHGCLEAYASAGALVGRYRERTGERVEAEEVVARAAGGDRVAQVLWDDVLDALALTIANYATLLAPELVVIGGGLAGAGDYLFGPLVRRLESLVRFAVAPAVVPAALGPDAGWRGAAIAASQAAGVSGLAVTSSATP